MEGKKTLKRSQKHIKWYQKHFFANWKLSQKAFLSLSFFILFRLFRLNCERGPGQMRRQISGLWKESRWARECFMVDDRDRGKLYSSWWFMAGLMLGSQRTLLTNQTFKFSFHHQSAGSSFRRGEINAIRIHLTAVINQLNSKRFALFTTGSSQKMQIPKKFTLNLLIITESAVNYSRSYGYF